MTVGAIGAVTSGGTSVYAVLSPYLNGVRRTSDAAQAAEISSASSTTSAAAAQQAIAANGSASAAAAAAPPFANPAITEIGTRVALGQSLTPPAGVTPDAQLGSTAVLGSGETATGTPSTSTTQNALQAALAANLTALVSLTTTPSPLAVPPLATSIADLTATNSLTAAQPSPTNQVLTGDSGLLIQSYGAVALAAAAQPLAAIYTPTITPAIPATADVTSVAGIEAVA